MITTQQKYFINLKLQFVLGMSAVSLMFAQPGMASELSKEQKEVVNQEVTRCSQACTSGLTQIQRGTNRALQMYFTVEGRVQDDAVILLHGGGLNSNMLQSLGTRLMQEHYRVWKLDTRGHGMSSNPSGQFSYDLLVDDLQDFISIHNIKKPIIVGYSDGGITALGFSIKYPTVARGIVPVAAVPVVRDMSHYMTGMEKYYGVRPKGSLQDWLTAIAADPSVIVHYTSRHLDGVELLKTAWWTWVNPKSYSAIDFAKIRIPVRLMIGKNDEFFTPIDARRMNALIRDSQLYFFDDNHLLFKNQPRVFEETVLHLVDEISQK